jgi:hypothetical protein
MTSPRPPRTRKAPATPPADPAEDNTSKVSPLFQAPADLPPAPPPFEMSQAREDRIMEGVMEAPSSLPNPFAAGPVVGSPSDTPSTDNPNKPAKLTRASVRGYAKKLLVAAGKYAQGRLTAPNSPERMEGLWLPDDDDVKDVADPVAGLVMRRIPSRAGGIVANPDVEDGLVLLLAVVAYVGKQLEKKDRIRQLYTQVTPDMTADDVEAVPA